MVLQSVLLQDQLPFLSQLYLKLVDLETIYLPNTSATLVLNPLHPWVGWYRG